jgi:hypothetical protein
MISEKLTKTRVERHYLEMLKKILSKQLDSGDVDYVSMWVRSGLGKHKPSEQMMQLMDAALYELEFVDYHAGYQPIPAHIRNRIKKLYRCIKQ